MGKTWKDQKKSGTKFSASKKWQDRQVKRVKKSSSRQRLRD